jgi:hypothetical protein
LEVELQHDAEAARERRIQGDWKIQAEDATALEHILQWREGLWLPWFFWVSVDGARWTECSINRRVLIE